MFFGTSSSWRNVLSFVDSICQIVYNCMLMKKKNILFIGKGLLLIFTWYLYMEIFRYVEMCLVSHSFSVSGKFLPGSYFSLRKLHFTFQGKFWFKIQIDPERFLSSGFQWAPWQFVSDVTPGMKNLSNHPLSGWNS